MGNQWKQWETIFCGSKIIADGDCCHEIKRHLLLGKKAMTNLDSILKSRDIALPTKVHLVKAMVFPVVMYGCESWTVKKAEHRRINALNCGVGEDSWDSLVCEEIQPVHSKGDQSWVFIGRTNAKAETPKLWPLNVKSWVIWKDPNAGRDWGQEEKGTTEDEMVGWQVNSRSWWWTGRPGMLLFMGSQRAGHGWVTELNWTRLLCGLLKCQAKCR